MHNNLINWLALYRTPSVGPIKFKKLLQEDPYLDRLPKIAQTTLNSAKNLIEFDLNWAKQDDCHIMLLCDRDYPKLLKDIADPPPILFIRGNRKLLMDLQVAIVGGRKASKLGEEIAYNFAMELAKLHIIITSGLALGIDTKSHQAAIAASKNATIAVLGHGLDMVYPWQNKKLVEQIIINGGSIISEFPTKTLPLAKNFPRRNRIISGLCLGTLLIEASIYSGSLLTARHALEQGREVFAVPGCIYDHNVKGCHALIKQGAKLVENVGDILEDLKDLDLKLNLQLKNKITCHNSNGLTEIENMILDYMGYKINPTDLIIAHTGFKANIVNAALVNLELSGYITAVPGGYVRVVV